MEGGQRMSVGIAFAPCGLPDVLEEDLLGTDWHQRAIDVLFDALMDLAEVERLPWHVGNRLALVGWAPDGSSWRPSPDVMVHPTRAFLGEACRGWWLDGKYRVVAWRPDRMGRYRCAPLGVALLAEGSFLRVIDATNTLVPTRSERIYALFERLEQSKALVRRNAELAGVNEQLAVGNEQLAGERAQLAGENEQLVGERAQLAGDNEQLVGERARLAGRNEELEEEIGRLRAEIARLRGGQR